MIDGKPLAIPPSSIQVRVLNGSGVDGAATRAAGQLTKKGYNVIGVADAESTDFLSTVVRYDPNYESSIDAARTLSASLDGAQRVEREGLGSTLEVVVGQEWPGVEPVVVKKPPTNDGVCQGNEDIGDVPG